MEATETELRFLLIRQGLITIPARLVIGDGVDGLDVVDVWDPLESTCRHASLSIL